MPIGRGQSAHRAKGIPWACQRGSRKFSVKSLCCPGHQNRCKLHMQMSVRSYVYILQIMFLRSFSSRQILGRQRALRHTSPKGRWETHISRVDHCVTYVLQWKPSCLVCQMWLNRLQVLQEKAKPVGVILFTSKDNELCGV